MSGMAALELGARPVACEQQLGYEGTLGMRLLDHGTLGYTPLRLENHRLSELGDVSI